MKKNQKTYLLLALVLTVWGILGFRIVKTVNPSAEELPMATNIGKFRPEVIKQRNTFSIVANYRDPFLGTLPKSNIPKKKKKAVTPKKEVLPDKDIRYTGLIGESTTGKKIFFLTIDGQQQMLNEKGVFNEVELISGSFQKIKVRYNGKTKSIPLTQ